MLKLFKNLGMYYIFYNNSYLWISYIDILKPLTKSLEYKFSSNPTSFITD